MRSTRAAQVALLSVLFSSCTFVAHADPTPSPSPFPTTSTDSFKTAMEQYKKDREAFNAAVRDRMQKIRFINQTFDQSVKKARQDSRIAMQAAVKPDQKSAINGNLKTIIATAITVREEALLALGEPPEPPTEPLRPAKSGPMMKDNGGKKNR
ncbi:MAG: hypothetical protein NTY85_05460 [Actinobacteria bacterium]|jgi:hypothetical protein|nr:hypothetical protein [Actinomycetota bacterium]